MAYQQDVQERAMAYGARMNEPLLPGDIAELHDRVDHNVLIGLGDARLAKVVRLRLVGYNRRDYPRWDVSYCYGQLKEGTDITLKEGRTLVRVLLPMRNPGRFWQKELVEWGRKNRVYVKGLGLFDGDVISELYG